MKSSSLLFFCLLLILCSVNSNKLRTFLRQGSEVTQVFCFMNSNGTIYDLNPLYNSASDYSLNVPNDKLYFNFCKKSLNACTNKTGLVIYRTDNECIELSGEENEISKWTINNNTNTNELSITIRLPEGDVCKSDPNARYKITEVITCDPNSENLTIDESSNDFNLNKCQHTIKLKSKHACPKFDVFGLLNAIANNKLILAPIMILFGIFFCFFGSKFVAIIQFVTGVIVVSAVTFYLIFAYVQMQFTQLEFWLICGMCVLLGLIAGYFLSKVERLVPAILSGILGYILGMFLYQIIFKLINYNPLVVFWVVVITCIILLVVLSLFFPNHFVIIPSAFIGSYSIIKGISFLAGGFPDERFIISLIERNEWAQLKELMNWQVYGYVAGFVILGIAGLYIQYKYFNIGEKKPEDNTQKTELIQK